MNLDYILNGHEVVRRYRQPYPPKIIPTEKNPPRKKLKYFKNIFFNAIILFTLVVATILVLLGANLVNKSSDNVNFVVSNGVISVKVSSALSFKEQFYPLRPVTYGSQNLQIYGGSTLGYFVDSNSSSSNSKNGNSKTVSAILVVGLGLTIVTISAITAFMATWRRHRRKKAGEL